jgi:hypothetical protein
VQVRGYGISRKRLESVDAWAEGVECLEVEQKERFEGLVEYVPRGPPAHSRAL